MVKDDPWAVVEVGAKVDPWSVSPETVTPDDPWAVVEVAPGSTLGEQFDHIKKMVSNTFGFTPVENLVNKTVTPTTTAVAKEVLSQTPMAWAYRKGKQVENLSRSGLKQVAAFIPEPNIGSVMMRPVQEVVAPIADELIGTSPSTETLASTANYVLGAPRNAADFTAEYAPSFISPEAAVLAGVPGFTSTVSASPNARKIAAEIVKRIPTPIKRALTYRFGQPEAYKELAEGSKIAEAGAVEKGIETARPLTKLSRADQQLASRYLKGEVAEVPENIKQMADAARAEFQRLGQEAVDLGLLDEVTYQTNLQTYMPRLYRAKEADKLAGVFPSKPERLNLDRFRKRMDIPPEVRESMGEIMEAGYPTAKGLTQLARSVEKAKMFRSVAQNPEWATADPVLAGTNGFTQLPTTKRLGDLSGKFVHPEIARDINELTKTPGLVQRVYDSFISKWKFGKVVANPATHFRNILSNSILLDLGGVSHIEQPRLLIRAASELSSKGKFYQEAKASGLLGHEFVGGEVRAFRDALLSEPFNPNVLQRSASLARNVGNKIGKVYQGEEQIFKLAKFIKNRRMGMDVKAATADAEKWLFNYEKVSPLVKAIRKSPIGAPFITFTSKALPRVAETAVTNPLRLYKYKLMFDAMEQVGIDRGVFTEKQRDIIKRNSRGQNVILPMKDDNGNPMVLDLSYILPWGDVGETGGMFGLPSVLPPSGPAKAILDIGYNKSTYNDQEIYNKKTDTAKEKVAKIADFIGKTLSPSLMPGVNRVGSPFKGGYSYQRLAAAIKKEPYPRESRRGRVQSVPSAIAHTILGLKTTGTNAAQVLADEILTKQRAQEDMIIQTQRLLLSKGISQEEKQRLIKDLQRKTMNLWKQK